MDMSRRVARHRRGRHRHAPPEHHPGRRLQRRYGGSLRL